MRDFLPLFLAALLSACGEVPTDGEIIADPTEAGITPKTSTMGRDMAADVGCSAAVAGKGSAAAKLTTLQIATGGIGIDLTGDGTVDNRLGSLAAVLNGALAAQVAAHDIAWGVELFEPSDSSCARAAFYTAVDETPSGDLVVSAPQIFAVTAGRLPGELSAEGNALALRAKLSTLWASFELAAPRAEVSATVRAGQPSITGGILAAAVSARSLAQITGVKVSGLIEDGQSLLDALITGVLADVARLPPWRDGGRRADIDVDGDGLEAFWASDPAHPDRVDTCRDGDGTVVKSSDDAIAYADPSRHCTSAKNAAGRLRFVDGWSIALRFDALPAQINGTR